MKKGQVINGYKVLEDPRTAGMCMWSFARKDGNDYFIKQFLRPTYPLDDAPGSAATKERIRKDCEFFERRHRRILEVLKEKTGAGGNLIITHQFFLHHTHYYKVTLRVNRSELTPLDVSKLELIEKLLVLITVAHSLRTLHSVGIVHGDIKPDNILISRSDTGKNVGKLIDFDDSYFAKEPPSPEEIVGDQKYYSPELAQYIGESGEVERTDLQTASDIFALGLVFSEYLTGKMPNFTPYPYAHEAAINGKKLILASSSLPVELKNLINQMLLSKYLERPTIESVFQLTRNLRSNLSDSAKNQTSVSREKATSGRLHVSKDLEHLSRSKNMKH